MKRAHPATTLEEVDQLLDAYTAGGPAAPSAQDTVAQARAVLLEHIPDMRYIAHSVRVLSRLASATDGVLGAELLASGAATELLAVLEETLEADDRSYMVLHHRAFTPSERWDVVPENDAFSGQLIAVVQWFRCVTQHWQPALRTFAAGVMCDDTCAAAPLRGTPLLMRAIAAYALPHFQ